MPLSDQDVTQVLDWLGRPQPVGQKQLTLATATGGVPAGGPVTGPSGTLTGSPVTGGGTDVGARGVMSGVTGGISPLTQAVRVADLVRRAAGIIPSEKLPGIGSQVGPFSEFGGPGVADFSANQAVIGDVMAAPTVAPTVAAGELSGGLDLGLVGAEEAFPGASVAGQTTTQAGTGLGGFGAIGAGLGAAGGIAQAVLARDDLHRGVGATNAALFSASVLQPELLPIAIASSLFTGGFDLVKSLVGRKPSVFDAKRKAASAAAAAGGSAFSSQVAQGAKSGSEGDLLASLGGQFGDQFGQQRRPIRVSLEGVDFSNLTPEKFSEFLNEVRAQLPAFRVQEQARQAAYAREVTARQGEQTAFDEQVKDFLAEGKSRGEVEVGTEQEKDSAVGLPRGWIRPPDLPNLPISFPPALGRIQGSGDVAYLEQGAAEGLAASVATSARQAILDFLLATPNSTMAGSATPAAAVVPAPTAPVPAATAPLEGGPIPAARMIVEGPTGALGFSREMLEAA